MNLRKHEWVSLRALVDGPRTTSRGWEQQLGRLAKRGLIARSSPYEVHITERGLAVFHEHSLAVLLGKPAP